jgi:hypothetical protein
MPSPRHKEMSDALSFSAAMRHSANPLRVYELRLQIFIGRPAWVTPEVLLDL